MINVDKTKLREYISKIFGSDMTIKNIEKLGEGFHALGFSIDTLDKKGNEKRYIMKTLRGQGFGQDYPADRASVFIRALMDYNDLPNHVKAIDVCSIQKDNSLLSLGKPEEFFIILEEGKGNEYWEDLDKIKNKEVLENEDVKRIKTLATYLGDIHSIGYDGENGKNLYRRVARDFVGHGELTMGVIDTFPPKLDFVTNDELVDIVKKMVEWWGKIKDNDKRLAVVHGDFYPGNIWFNNGKLLVLDRSRFRYGEPADDTSSLTMNFINYSIMAYGEFRDPFKELVEIFFKEYFDKRDDPDIFKVAPLFYAFRALVCIHPIFYSPEWLKKHGFDEERIVLLNESKRKTINFIKNMLNEDEFDVKKINSYIKD